MPRYDWTGTTSVPDDDPTGASVTFAAGAAAGLQEVSVWISCDEVHDLVVTVQAPDGTTRTVVSHQGFHADMGIGSADASRMRFGDAATNSVTYAGSHDHGFCQPQAAFSAIGAQAAGTWTVKVVDSVAGNGTAVINAVSLITPFVMPDVRNTDEAAAGSAIRAAITAQGINPAAVTVDAYSAAGSSDADHLGEPGYAATVGADGSISWQDPIPAAVVAALSSLDVRLDVWGVTDPAAFLETTAALYGTAPAYRLFGATPGGVGALFTSRWASGLHVGDASPRMVVEVRRGRWDRDYVTISGGEALDATIYGETDTAPWMATWDPAEDWLEVPGIVDYSEQHAFTENGCQIVTLTMDNVRFAAATGTGELAYHRLERGYASPTRGYVAAGRPADGLAQNEWYNRLGRMAQIRVWQGYGDPVRNEDGTMPTDGGPNGLWVFVGQIDDIDPTDAPDHITITARNGQPLTDQEFFGWSKSSQLHEPVVFADRTDAAGNPAAARWILVDDAADVVRVVLRWAGYHDLSRIADTGARLKGHHAYNRENKLIEAISDVVEQTGFIFSLNRPTDGDQLAQPVFAASGARSTAPAGMTEITEDDLITALEYKQSMAPLAYIIRIRGKEVAATSGGVTLGGDTSTRVMATYRPPWSFEPSDPDLLEDRLGGLLKHVTITRPQLRTAAECLDFAKLLALNEALDEVQVIAEIPGNPAIGLDDQVGVTDSTTAINSRLWVAARTNDFTTGKQTTWRTTLTGPLLDFPDVAAMLTELEA